MTNKFINNRTMYQGYTHKWVHSMVNENTTLKLIKNYDGDRF